MKKIILLLLLTSCTNTTDGVSKDLSNFRTRLADKIRPQTATAVTDPAQKASVFCYKTLDKPDCYAEPVPGQEDRLIK